MPSLKDSVQNLSDSPAVFKMLRFEALGCSQAMAADLLGVNVKTVKRWESGAARIPRAAVLALHLLAGDLGALWPDWIGWRLDGPGGRVVAPNGYTFDCNEMAALPYRYAQIADAERRAGNTAPALPVSGNVAPIRWPEKIGKINDR